MNPKVEKPLVEKKKRKNSKTNEEIIIKRSVCYSIIFKLNLKIKLSYINFQRFCYKKKDRLSKTKQILEDTNISKPIIDLVKPVVIPNSESITKKASDSLTPKGN